MIKIYTMKKYIPAIGASFLATASLFMGTSIAAAKPPENDTNTETTLSADRIDLYAAGIIEDERNYRNSANPCFKSTPEEKADPEFFICFSNITLSSTMTPDGVTKEVCALYSADKDIAILRDDTKEADITNRYICTTPLPPLFLV